MHTAAKKLLLVVVVLGAALAFAAAFGGGWVRAQTPPPATAPAAPVLSVGATGNASVPLSWTTPANGGSAITGYKVYRGTASAGETLYASLGVVNTYTDTSATNGTTWYYQVTAVNAVGESARSNEVSATPTWSPTAPQNLSGAGAGSNSVNLTWTAPASNNGSAIQYYNVYRGTTSGGETLTASSTVTSFTNSGLTAGTLYYYQVSAKNGVGEGPKSNEISIGSPAAPSLSQIPGNLQVALSWTIPSTNNGGAITSYKVYRGITSGGETLVASGGCSALGNVTSCTDSGLTNGTTYYYQVSAVNAVGEGARPPEILATPQNLTKTAILWSSVFDTGYANGVALDAVYWLGNQPSGTVVEFQIASSNCSNGATNSPTCNIGIGSWSFLGPDGTASTQYVANQNVAAPINTPAHLNQRYFRYKVYLLTDASATVSPRVDDVVITYSP